MYMYACVCDGSIVYHTDLWPKMMKCLYDFYNPTEKSTVHLYDIHIKKCTQTRITHICMYMLGENKNLSGNDVNAHFSLTKMRVVLAKIWVHHPTNGGGVWCTPWFSLSTSRRYKRSNNYGDSDETSCPILLKVRVGLILKQRIEAICGLLV